MVKKVSFVKKAGPKRVVLPLDTEGMIPAEGFPGYFSFRSDVYHRMGCGFVKMEWLEDAEGSAWVPVVVNDVRKRLYA